VLKKTTKLIQVISHNTITVITNTAACSTPSAFYLCISCVPGQLSLAIPPWVGAVSTSQSCDVNRHTARCSTSVPVPLRGLVD